MYATLRWATTSRSSLADPHGIQSLRAYLSVQNPFIICSPFHKETGLDPETNSYGNENVAVTEGIQKRFLTVGTNSPSTRNYLFGINLTF